MTIGFLLGRLWGRVQCKTASLHLHKDVSFYSTPLSSPKHEISAHSCSSCPRLTSEAVTIEPR